MLNEYEGQWLIMFWTESRGALWSTVTSGHAMENMKECWGSLFAGGYVLVSNYFFFVLNNVKELENVKQIVFSVSLRQHSGEQTKAAFIRACLWWRVLYGPYKWALEGVLGWGSINGYLMLECGTDSASVHLCWSHESYTHAGFTISWFADRLQKIWS